MRNQSVILALLTCCIGPVVWTMLVYMAGMRVGRRGFPLHVEWRGRDPTPRRARSFARDDEGLDRS